MELSSDSSLGIQGWPVISKHYSLLLNIYKFFTTRLPLLGCILLNELRVVPTLRSRKQIRSIHQVDLDVAPLAIERLVCRPVADAVDSAEITHNLRVHLIEITQTRSPVHRRPANRRN